MNVPILAEEYLSRIAELKKEMDECQIEIRLVYAKLTKYLAEGHLDYLKSSSGSITYKNKQNKIVQQIYNFMLLLKSNPCQPRYFSYKTGVTNFNLTASLKIKENFFIVG